MAEPRYTVTIYVAAPGTPLKLDSPKTSLPGHMFYATSNGKEKPNSFGFAPVVQGNIDGPGHISYQDLDNYKDPLYARTMEISRSQYETLNDFGLHPERHGFDTYYKDARHNCVDFTWAALNHVGIQRVLPFGKNGIPLDGPGAARPAHNVDAVESIHDPMPGSPLNKVHRNPMPEHRNLIQHLLSEQEAGPRIDQPSHPGHALHQQALHGVERLNARHGLAASERDSRFAAALAVAAQAQGLQRIDHVLLGDDASRAFAVQGHPNGVEGLDRRIAWVQTIDALNAPLAQSSSEWYQASAAAEPAPSPEAPVPQRAAPVHGLG